MQTTDMLLSKAENLRTTNSLIMRGSVGSIRESCLHLFCWLEYVLAPRTTVKRLTAVSVGKYFVNLTFIDRKLFLSWLRISLTGRNIIR